MTIPEAQLETWSHQGAIKQSRDTYATVKAALEANDAPYAGKSYASFLQGSYGNDTNIFADSDVDVVMRLDDVYYTDLGQLPQEDKDAYNKARSNADYSLADFKRDVLAQLTKKFGTDASMGTKAIYIQASGNRRESDVLPAALLRRYHRFKSFADQDYVEGICFFAKDGTRIDNFPKQHSDNCTTKHQQTNQWFKHSVRTYKNARNKMIDKGMIEEGLAPSYYLEGLLYNVPADRFGGTYTQNFCDTLDWLVAADRSNFVCANEQFYLLREGSPVTWRAASCAKFLTQAVELWHQW
jgi:hypothetical protein